MTNSNYIELNQLYEKYKDQGLHFDSSCNCNVLSCQSVQQSLIFKMVKGKKNTVGLNFTNILFIHMVPMSLSLPRYL